MDTIEALQLAQNLMETHNLTQKGWGFSWSLSKREFGRCCHRTKTIELSGHLTFLNDEAQVRDTILHEIAHALTPGARHNSRWKAKASEIGAKPERCYRVENVNVPARYIYECPNCGAKAKYWKRSAKLKRSACGKCCKAYANGSYDSKFSFIEKRIFTT